MELVKSSHAVPELRIPRYFLPDETNPYLKYGLLIAAYLLAFLIQVLLSDEGVTLTFLALYPMVVVVSLTLGLIPSLLLTFVGGTLNTFYFTDSAGGFFHSQAVGLAGFVLSGCLISFLSESHRRTLKRAKEDLESRIATEQELKRSNAELEQFAYITSHDLKEPIRTLSSFSQLLVRTDGENLSKEGKESLHYIVQSSQRLYDIVESVLEYAKTGKRLQSVETNANDVFEKALLGLTSQIQETGAQVTAGPLPWVNVDPAQLAQIFQNLISNSLKYCNGVPRVHVSAKADRDSWIFLVRDNGLGIDPKYHDRVFGIFRRLNRRESGSGTGLGLAICKRIVERHGGKIWVKSQPGEGSSFYFSLPSARARSEGES